MRKISFFVIAVLFAVAGYSQNIVADSSFEAGSPSSTWYEYSSNFGTPFCDANCGTCGGPCVPRSGSWYVWFGGIAAAEEGEVAQYVTIPSGSSATLSFYVMVPIGAVAGIDSMEVFYGTNKLFSVSSEDTTLYATYTKINVDMTSYLGTSDSLIFYCDFQSGETTNILIDDISLRTSSSSGLIENHLLEGIEVYPNPATEHIFVNVNSPVTVDIKINMYDMSGRKVLSETHTGIDSKKIDLNTAGLGKGVYYLMVDNGSENLSHRIVIE